MKKTRIQSVALIAALAFVLPISTITTLCAQSNVNNVSATDQSSVHIVDENLINSTTVEIVFSNEQKMLLDFYGNNIFRMFQDNSGKGLRAPEAKPEAKILLDNPRRLVDRLNGQSSDNTLVVRTNAIELTFDKSSTKFTIKDLRTNQVVVQSIAPIAFENDKVCVHNSTRCAIH